jgi:hypothetical protein
MYIATNFFITRFFGKMIPFASETFVGEKIVGEVIVGELNAARSRLKIELICSTKHTL